MGSEGFRANLRKELAARSGLKPGRFAGLEPEEWQQERERTWEEKLQAAGTGLQIDLAALPTRKSALAKVQLAAILKRMSDVSNGWLARRLAMGEPASVSQFVRRFRLGGGEGNVVFQRALSRVKV